MTKLSIGMYVLLFTLLSCSPKIANSPTSTSRTTGKSKIQVALCLDTSNSMDGLIDQTKSQLWKMVNELASSKRDGEIPDIELALYEYGNSGLAATDGYIRQVSALTTDLDLISEKLFAMKTNGGDEYCGWTIQNVTNDLEWSKSNEDLKLIIIAGNEPFNQGKVDYKVSCKAAITKGIMINTIHCGDYETGVRTFWKDGADLADGEYMNINQDAKVVHIETPFDAEILRLNQQLNDTYIGFGRSGRNRKEMQMEQDANAAYYGDANNVERAVSKSKAAYRNEEWDLVDAMKSDEKILDNVKKEDLPTEMEGMTKKEQKEYVESKSKERDEIQAKINDLNKKRQDFITEKQNADGESLTLDKVMLKAVRKQAEAKNYQFEE
ncbi:MAG: VWA domain-containing protein [Saprospiraceae bacterium]|nr:VWA domain-containing protein [Saprospiraceae bacterium]